MAEQQQIERVALAALMHDVGKFAHRAEADPETPPDLANFRDFAVTDSHGHISHHHAAHTWHFIAENFPWLARSVDGEGSIARWASRHHKPAAVWEWVVAEADRLAAGFDNGHPDEGAAGWANLHNARLSPVACHVGGPHDGGGFEIALRALAFDDRLFAQHPAARTRQQAADEYRNLFAQFTREARTLLESDPEIFFQNFLSVYERYAWCVPAAVADDRRDVSLFEHSRAAAAIAAALAAELLGRGTPTVERVRDRNARRYAMAVGDLGGIQRFLYTIVSRNAARALRGRSLALQLVTDAIGNLIVRELGMPLASILYNGGGRLWILLPASARGRARELAERIDLALHDRYAGRLSFSLGMAELSGRDFIERQVGERLAAAAQDLQNRRRRRFTTLMRAHYDEIFAPRGDPANESPCRICGKLAVLAQSPDEQRAACEECRDFALLGAALVRATTIIRAHGPDWSGRLARCGANLGNVQAFELPALDSGYLLYSGSWESAIEAAAEGLTAMRINQPPDTAFRAEAASGMWLVGAGRAQNEAGEAIDFDSLAAASTGVRRLGVLRMDVDSLGEIFRSSLRVEHSILPRLTSLSRTLSYFFGGYVSGLLLEPRWRDRAQIIYSGGDDLFIVAAWSAAPYLAREIRQRFACLVGGNPAWGLSGGIAMVRPRFPVAAAAEAAGREEQQGKQYAGRAGGRTKDAIRFFGETMSWNDLDVADALARELCEMLGNGAPRSRAMLHKMAEIAASYRRSRGVLQARAGSGRPIAEIEEAARRGRWAWTAACEMGSDDSNPALRVRLGQLAKALPGNVWGGLTADHDLIWLMEPAVHWADWLTRKGD